MRKKINKAIQKAREAPAKSPTSTSPARSVDKSYMLPDHPPQPAPAPKSTTAPVPVKVGVQPIKLPVRSTTPAKAEVTPPAKQYSGIYSIFNKRT